jgi:hypothetical protein
MTIHAVLLSKEEAPLGELIDVCNVALALIQERGQIVKSLRADAASEERNDVFDAAVKRLKELEGISIQVHLAIRDAMPAPQARVVSLELARSPAIAGIIRRMRGEPAGSRRPWRRSRGENVK